MVNRIFLTKIFYVLFVAATIYTVYLKLETGYAKESWQITEWLISYQGGFVRRGLPGELIFQLHHHFHLNPYHTILTISFLSYLLLAVFFIYNFIKKGFPLIILTGPFLLGGPLLNDFWVRKDTLSLLGFLLATHFATKKTIPNLILTNFFLMISLLTHESIGFYGLSIIFLLLFKQWSSVIKTTIFILPSFIIFLVCLANRGSHNIANGIWESWKPVTFPTQNNNAVSPIPAALDGLRWTNLETNKLLLNTLTNFNDGVYAPLAWFLIIISIYYLLINLDKIKFSANLTRLSVNFNHTHISNILIWQFIVIFPLFILGWDYGRWTFLWVTSSLIVLILTPNQYLSNLFPKFISKVSPLIFSSHNNISLLFLIIGVPVYSWSLNGYLNSAPLYVVVKFLSTLIHNLSPYTGLFFSRSLL